MAQLTFTANVQRHLHCPAVGITGDTVAEVLETYFSEHPRVRGYILDDQGAVRKHILIMMDGMPIRDRQHLSDPTKAQSEIFVLQALSGG